MPSTPCACCDQPGATIPSTIIPGAHLCADTRACIARACPTRSVHRKRRP